MHTSSLHRYFAPDLPSEVKIAQKRRGPAELDEKFRLREAEWRARVPRRLANKGRYLVSATDETNVMRFLPTYLAKSPPPRDVLDPMLVACMVKNIAFQADHHQQHGAEVTRAAEVWSTPNYFIDLKEGASEDHAILQCSLFLGMGLDAYALLQRRPILLS